MKTIFLLLIIPLFLLSSKQYRNLDGTAVRTWAGTNSNIGTIAAPPVISIADMRIVEGNAGQIIAQVMVSISQITSGPVTVAYSTRNGTALADIDYVATKGSIAFAPGDLMKRIIVSIIGEVICEEDEKFEIVLSNASGATLEGNAGTVTIVNDDCMVKNVPGTTPPTNHEESGNNGSGTKLPTSIAGSGNFPGHLSVYEVRLTHTGYTTFSGTPADCPIRSNGKVVLTGLLKGAENVPDDDDIRYTGTLQLDIDIDICSAKTEEDPGGGYPLCGMTVTGAGVVNAELEIYFDGRGGYIKIKNESGRFTKSVYGTCDQAQIGEERTMVPNKTIAVIFNGRDLPMLTDRTLRVGRYVETDGGNETVVEVLRAVRR